MSPKALKSQFNDYGREFWSFPAQPRVLQQLFGLGSTEIWPLVGMSSGPRGPNTHYLRAECNSTLLLVQGTRRPHKHQDPRSTHPSALLLRDLTPQTWDLEVSRPSRAFKIAQRVQILKFRGSRSQTLFYLQCLLGPYTQSHLGTWAFKIGMASAFWSTSLRACKGPQISSCSLCERNLLILFVSYPHRKKSAQVFLC